MTMRIAAIASLFTLAFAMNAALAAQGDDGEDEMADADHEAGEPDADNMADALNARQQLEQTYTLKRSINGELVETQQRTITLDPDDPIRATEVGDTAVERLRQAFDGEALTRAEALAEARLDFTNADVDRNGALTREEFGDLLILRQANGAFAGAVNNPYPSDKEARQATEEGLRKFDFIAGAQRVIDRSQFIQEYLVDFDAMDQNDDSVLMDDELIRFRAMTEGRPLRF